MEFEPVEYVRKSFSVRAHEVTFQNVDKIAKWCNGTVGSELTRVLGGAEVELPIVKFPGQGADKGKELVAKLGNYVVQFKNRFQVYKEPQFFATFEQAVPLQEEEQVGGWLPPAETDRDDEAEAIQEHEDALHNAGQL